MGSITLRRGNGISTALVVAALIATGCAADGTSPTATGAHQTDSTSDTTDPTESDDVATASSGTDRRPATGAGGPFVRALAPFDDCAAFLNHVKAEARERVGPYGLDPDGWWYADDFAVADSIDDATEDTSAASDDGASDVAEESAEASAAGEPADDGDSAGGDFTDTNVQEVGVDEPDVIKTDGDRILVVRDNRLIHIDIAGDSPRITDEVTIPEGWGHELFFVGDRAVLFTNGGGFGDGPIPLDAEADLASPVDDMGAQSPAAIIIEVDLGDPSNLSVTSTLTVEGQYLSARRIDDTIRLALASGPQQMPWLHPQSEAGEERAEQANRELIDESTLEDWVPEYQLEAVAGQTSGALLGCDQLNHPAEFSGFDVVSVLSISLTDGIGAGFDPARAVGVLASGQTVYSSLDRFYVATTKWVHADDIRDGTVPRGWNDDYETELHAFAITTGEPARYVASGSVGGSLLNQFSLDEHEGYLRVVTTEGSPWGDSGTSESGLTVLAEQGEQLAPVGHVGGLGKGEQLYSARLMGDVGFAVTFRQIDPFYVLDLSDPANPRVTGELKIPGVSTYLHPLDEDRVLGIGQDATTDGMTTGLKVSMFDVSNPADPRETAVWTLPGANSMAEYDHRAFQMWGSTVILPVESWQENLFGAILLDVGDGITEVGRVNHTKPDGEPSSDCRPIEPHEVPEDSELFWMAREAEAHVQLCEPDDRGGWGNHYCDRIPVEEIVLWGGDPEATKQALSSIGGTEGDFVETCWPDEYFGQQIERSLVADGVLYTLTQQAIQANDIESLDLVAHLPLR